MSNLRIWACKLSGHMEASRGAQGGILPSHACAGWLAFAGCFWPGIPWPPLFCFLKKSAREASEFLIRLGCVRRIPCQVLSTFSGIYNIYYIVVLLYFSVIFVLFFYYKISEFIKRISL